MVTQNNSGPSQTPDNIDTSGLLTTSTASSTALTTSTQEVTTTPQVQTVYATASTILASTTATLTPVTASPTISSISIASPANNPSRSTVSTGALAGAIIGAAIGGALIAFILAALCMRSRKQPRQTERPHLEKKRSSVNMLMAGGRFRDPGEELVSRRNAWESHLPQPADDNSIRLALKTLFHQVELHVENFYTDSTAVQADDKVQNELVKFDSGCLPAPLPVLMHQTQSRTVLIKHCLAHLLVSNVSTDGKSQGSFLPTEFIALPDAIERSNRTDEVKPASAEARSRWRVLTAYLRPETINDQAYLRQRDTAICAAATAFCSAFDPWASPSHAGAARHQNLLEIMRSASEVGILIFAQPSEFEYGWENARARAGAGTGRRMVVVTPSFAKVSDEWAKPLNRPQVLVPAVSSDI